MSEAGNQVLKSLELFSECSGDPTAPIYQLLFERHPSLEELFILDTDEAVRGSMLQNAFECIFDYWEDNRLATNFVATSRLVHDGYGVPVEKFDEFFEAIRDSCRVALGDQWTRGMENAWQTMLDDFAKPA